MVKYKIGIIGTENSHADSFAAAFNKPDEKGNYRYPDCRVTCVWGHYDDANKRIAENFGVEKIAASLDEIADSVDAVMITARDGKFHAEFALPFIERGKPAFIDKPFTVDIDEAVNLVKLAKSKGVSLCGGSSLKHSKNIKEMAEIVEKAGTDLLGGSLSAPLQINSEYSGFFFYASHLVEMTLNTFGFNPKSITAVRNGETVTATINYGDFSVSNHFLGGVPDYTGTVYKKNGSIQTMVSLDGVFDKECDDFVNMLRTGEMPESYEKLITPVYYMNAVKTSYETGRGIEIKFDNI